MRIRRDERVLWLAIVLASASCASSRAPSSVPASRTTQIEPTPVAPDPRAAATAGAQTADVRSDFAPERTLLDESNAARAASDYAAARDRAARAIESLLSRPDADRSADWLKLLSAAGTTAWRAQDVRSAHGAWRLVYDVRSAQSPDDDPDLQRARLNLARALEALGNLPEARALAEKALEVDSRTLPDDHPELQRARSQLAGVLYTCGDLVAARALDEKVLDVRSRSPATDPLDLARARGNLAITLKKLGDLEAARVLEEQALESFSRALADDDPELQAARGNLAGTLFLLGDFTGAQAIFEKVLETSARTLPEEHPGLQAARLNLASTLVMLGDLVRARTLFEKVLEVRSNTLPSEHPDVQEARQDLAATLWAIGDADASRALHEEILEVRSRTLPDDHPDLQATRKDLATELASTAKRTTFETAQRRCAELIGSLCTAQTQCARRVLLTSPPREAEQRCDSMFVALDAAISFASGAGVFDPSDTLARASFVLSETTRAAALSSAVLMRCTEDSVRYAGLRDEVSKCSDELAELVYGETSSDDFQRVLARREAAERELIGLARELRAAIDFDLDALAAKLDRRDAVVAYRKYRRTWFESSTTSERPIERVTDRFCAFVVRHSAPPHGDEAVLTLIDLGEVGAVEDAVRDWRAGLGESAGRGVTASAVSAAPDLAASGERLRRLVFDPLATSLGDADHVTVALDDVIHLVPLDALPADPRGVELIGDHLRIDTRSTLTELLQSSTPLSGRAELVAFGDIEYGADPPTTDALAQRGTSLLRGTVWERGFPSLPSTGAEARGIVECFRRGSDPDAKAVLSEGTAANRERLNALAQDARFLHLATHGWFAPESIRSWSDPTPIDVKLGLGARMSGGEEVKGMSPMLLCGLALAGANLPAGEASRARGLITAEELSTLDLSNCELAVLSACDTSIGVRRAGQGVASLQQALQMAGARSVITSLWKVPDEATKDLMLDFYRRLWVEKKPKWQALWEAKKALRDAKYSTRDWAAWVLTGNPE